MYLLILIVRHFDHMAAKTKTCHKCNKRKSIAEFYKNKNLKDGHTANCKKCVRELAERRYQRYELNRPNIKSKVCSRCKEEKPIKLFSKDRKSKDGLQTYCNVCTNVKAKEWATNNYERHLTNIKRWQSDNKKVVNAKNLKWQRKKGLLKTKICRVCRKRTPLSEFYKNKNLKDGLTAECKHCIKEASEKRFKRYAQNKTKIKTKVCVRCKEEKTIELFGKDRRSKDGYNGYCRTCMTSWVRIYEKEHPKKAAAAKAKWRAENYEFHKSVSTKWNKNNPEKAIASTKRSLKKKAIFSTYASQLTVDEAVREDSDGYLLVKCTYCGKNFHPLVREVLSRIRALQISIGEGRLYCSGNCKLACPVYNMHIWPRGFKPATSREAQPILRQVVLERDDYKCQICYKCIPDIELHCHHILGYKQHRAYAEDPDNCVSLCKKCHKKVHKLPGCNYKDLRCKEPSTKDPSVPN